MTRPYRFERFQRFRLTILALAACARDAPPPRRAPAASAANVAPCGRVEASADTAVRTVVVSENARGMATAVRWARSPDGCALLVVEDPAGVEAEPIPDVAHHVRSARGALSVVRVDSVWDVAPDSAWRRLVVGRAYVARGAGADSLPTAAWTALAAAVGRSVADVRAAAFPTSGMSVAMGVARPAWAELPRGGRGVTWHALPVLGGWRVRWAPDDSTLLIGRGPRRATDDAPAAAWLRVDASTGTPRGAPLSLPGDPVGVAWHRAPLLDVSTAVALDTLPAVPTSGGTIVSRDGRVVLLGSRASAVDLGPGAPLAATEDARVVLAVAPRTAAADGQSRWRVVLYVRGVRAVGAGR